MSHQHENCSCLSNPTAGSQTLDEMDFEKSICAAALNRDLVRVKELINKGKINDRDHYGYNALAYAARNGDLQMCQLLIENGIDVNAKTHSNSTPMHRAAMMGEFYSTVFIN
jgi:GA-binding protein transcription factor beta